MQSTAQFAESLLEAEAESIAAAEGTRKSNAVPNDDNNNTNNNAAAVTDRDDEEENYYHNNAFDLGLDLNEDLDFDNNDAAKVTTASLNGINPAVVVIKSEDPPVAMSTNSAAAQVTTSSGKRKSNDESNGEFQDRGVKKPRQSKRGSKQKKRVVVDSDDGEWEHFSDFEDQQATSVAGKPDTKIR